MIDIPLLPIPKKLKAMAGFWKIPKTGIIVLDHYENQDQSDRESIAYAAKKLAACGSVRVQADQGKGVQTGGSPGHRHEIIPGLGLPGSTSNSKIRIREEGR